jgi:hypothetical protein
VVGRDDGKPVVLVASDQNFPPVLFSEDEGPCIAIMRMEFGTVKELGFAIGDMLHGISLPAGSIILVGSTSDLGKQGIVGYTDELARTLRIVKDKQGRRIQVVALPPVLLGGINSFMLLRLVVEAEHWAERLEGGAGVLLMRTRSEVVRMIGKHSKGTVTNPEEKVDLLLKKVDGYERVRVRSAVWEDMPERMLPLTVEGEQIILGTLTEELRRNFGVKVSGRLEMERGEGKEKPVYKYAVLGASNADRLGDVLVGMKKDVVKVTKGGWRPSKQGVAEMLEMMKDVDLEGRVIILYGLDNGVFYSEDEDGDRSLPKADESGTYHIVGKTELATQKQVKGLVANCEPILDKVKDNKKMLVSAGVRYYRESCCVVEGHCANLGEGGYRKGMLEDLARLKEAVEEECREKDMRGYKVVSPVELLGIRSPMSEDELIQIVGDHPVHMTAFGYMKLAGSMVSMVEGQRSGFAGDKRGREEEGEDAGGIDNFHRKRHEWLYNFISGAGGWRGGQQGGAGGQERGRGAARGAGRGQPRGTSIGKGFDKGPMGGNF